MNLSRNDNEPQKRKETEASKLLKNQPMIPYSAKVRKDQQDKKFNNFLDMFRALHINIRFVESLGINATICQAFERVPYQQEVRSSVNYHPQ